MRKLLLPPIAWIASLAAMFVAHDYLPLYHAEPEAWRSAFGSVAFVLAVAVTVWHKRLFRQSGTNVDTFGEPGKLIESGLFAYVRNPMYLGFVGSLAALALLSGALTPWLIALGFFVLADRWYIPFEERAMRARFGAAYESYRTRTRRWV